MEPSRTLSLAKALALLLGLVAAPAFAHKHTAYSHDSGISHTNSDWMKYLPDKRRLKDLSLPGTHDTMTYDLDNHDIAMTQAKTLKQQLDAGIRVLDIRCRRINNRFHIYHGFVTTHFDFDDVLTTVKDFLDDHPTETVLMRIKPEGDIGSNDPFQTVFETYSGASAYKDYFWTGTSSGVSLGEVRKKIVVLADFENNEIGIDYGGNIQDDYDLDDNWDLYHKWLEVKDQIVDANSNSTEGSRGFYFNYLSGSGGSFPYFVASGHSSPGTDAPRLLTGKTTPGWSSYKDFPRVDCFLGICSIIFEGTNVLAYEYIDERNSDDQSDNDIKFTGIMMMDFPGQGLIDQIIGLNTPATVYSKSGYAGTVRSAKMGSSALSALGIGDNELESVSIADGLIATMYDGNSYVEVSDNTSDLSTVGFANMADSITIDVEGAVVFEHGSYRGRMQILKAGNYNVSALLDNDVISSIRVGTGYKVYACKDSGYSGGCTTYTEDKSGLGSYNDEISSLKVIKE